MSTISRACGEPLLGTVRLRVWLLLIFTVLLGLMHWLYANQGALLYLYYLPVIAAAMVLRKRDAVGVAGLAAAMVLAFGYSRPEQLYRTGGEVYLWAALVIWGGVLVTTAYVVSMLKARLQTTLENLSRAYEGILAILSRFIQTVDTDTRAHCSRVSMWAVRIARELHLDGSQIEAARITGLLHDVGKAEVSVDLLRKAATLSDAEQEQVRTHAACGAAMVRQVGGILEQVAEAIEAHHEKYDGSGYGGMAGRRIPLLARIIAVADAFDALVSDRPYRKGVGTFEALTSIQVGRGSHFDPDVVDALQRIVDREGESAAAPDTGSYAAAP